MSYQLEEVIVEVRLYFLVPFLFHFRSMDEWIQSLVRTFVDLQFWSDQLSNMALIYRNIYSILVHLCRSSFAQQLIVDLGAS